jgi:potassium-dependent mechanosensitive channel
MNSNVSVTMRRVFWLLSLCPMIATLQAQSPRPASPKPSASASAETRIDAIPLPQVAEQADESTRLQRDIRRRLPPPEALARAEREAAALDEELGEKLREVGELTTSSPALLELRELERYWRRKKSSITPLKHELNQRLSWLSRDISLLEAQQARWQATLQQMEDPAALPAISDSIRAVLSDIQSARSQIQQHFNGFARVQNRISRQDLAVSDVLETIATVKEHFYDTAFSKNSLPLWAARFQPEPDQPLESPAHTSLIRDYYALRDLPRVRLYLFGLIVLLLAAPLIAQNLRRRINVWIERGVVKGDEAWLFKRPSSLLFLPGLFCLIPFSSRLPFGIVILISMLLLIPVLRLLPPLIDPLFRPLVFALIGFYLLNGIKGIIPISRLLDRELSAVGTIAVVAVFAWLTRPSRVGKLMVENRGARHVILAIRVMLVLLAGSLLANIFGYVVLANVLGQGTLLGAYLAVVFGAVIWVARRAFTVLLRTEWAGRLAIVKLHRSLIIQWFTRVLTGVLFMMWLAATLEMFGLRNEIVGAIYAILNHEIGIGAFRFSLGSLLLFVLILAVSLMIARLLRFVLEKEILAGFSLQRGLSTLISTSAYYVVLLLGFMLALASAGIELSRFTLLTGAFGVGIGFGLQNIFNNFVSGIILLFERPVQAGDIVEVGGVGGEVTHIGMRASTIRTGLGAEVIVPNSSLISSQVINWTRSDNKRRVDLEVRVAYGSDLAMVLGLLQDAAAAHPKILSKPEPVAVFLGFGEKSLNFELRFWVPNSVNWPELRSRVAVTVAAKLREAGINSPTELQEYPPSSGGSAKESEQKQDLAGSPDSQTSQARVSGNS